MISSPLNASIFLLQAISIQPDVFKLGAHSLPKTTVIKSSLKNRTSPYSTSLQNTYASLGASPTPSIQYRGGRKKEAPPPVMTEDERRQWEKERLKKDNHNISEWILIHLYGATCIVAEMLQWIVIISWWRLLTCSALVMLITVILNFSWKKTKIQDQRLHHRNRTLASACLRRVSFALSIAFHFNQTSPSIVELHTLLMQTKFLI